MGNKLFAVYLGGRAPKCNTELHDIVFVTGEAIDETYQRLIDRWLGTPKGLHIDSWIELDIVDGYKSPLTAAVLKFRNVGLENFRAGYLRELIYGDCR